MIEQQKREPISFDELCSELKPCFSELESVRQIFVKKATKRYGISFVVAFIVVTVLLLMVLEPGHTTGILVTSGILAVIIGGASSNVSSQEYLNRYKSEVIGTFVEHIIENGTYIPNRGIDCDVFERCALFDDPDRYSSEDFIAGKIGKTEIGFAEVHAEKRKVQVDSNGNKTTTWSDIFKGFLFAGDFNKYFKGQTIVTRNFRFFRNAQKVKLENPEFERTFKTYSTDGIEARYILTPSLMERMMALTEMFKQKKIAFSFIDSKIVIAIENHTNHFETSIWQKPDDPKILRREYDMLCAMVNIVEELNLNTRIWTKS